MGTQKPPPSEDVLHTEAHAGVALVAVAFDHSEDLIGHGISTGGRDAWLRFRRNRAAVVALVVVLALLIAAICAPWMHTADPLTADFSAINQEPSSNHWFGTDSVGRDQYSRLLYGLRIPLIVALLGTAITVVIGVLTGVVAGYGGGPVDELLSRFTDVMFAFPAFLLALIVVSLFGPALDPYFGGGGRVILLTAVFALVSWPSLMRFVRSQALHLKEQQFVEAARVCGSSGWKIIARHLLPNIWGLVFVQASFIAVSVISTETTLSIFGLGVQPPNPDLGQMLYDGVQHLGLGYADVAFPSIALTAVILGFTLLGNGVRDALDPRMHN